MFIKEVEDFLKQDRYICKSEYYNFLSGLNLQENEELSTGLKEHNDNYIKMKLNKEKEYFDHIYDNVNLGMVLDNEQRTVILADDDYCLINAGAGSGKSTTIAAKAKYLIDKKSVNPEEICMLSYTKKSAEDLEEKINALINDKVKVSTFHSLGMNILREMYDYPIKVAGETEQKNIIIKYVKSLFKDKAKLNKVIECFPYIQNRKTHFFFPGFIKNYNKFDNFDDYFEDYKQRKYAKEQKRQGGIREYIAYRTEANMEFLTTIKGEKCKSIGEVKIANFLFENGIDYTYERVLEERVEEKRSYSPDFTIYWQGEKYYIEYFGLSSCYTNGRPINERIKKYERVRRKKEQFQKLHPEYNFINLDYKIRDEQGNPIFYLESLEEELKNIGINIEKISDKEMFDAIISTNIDAEIFEFVKLILKFISSLKGMLISDIDTYFEKVKMHIDGCKIEFNYYSLDLEKEREQRKQTIDILKEIYYFYENELVSGQMVDYADMIDKTYRYIKTNPVKTYNFKYIIVDEYQDITIQRYLFVKALVDYFGAKLVSVGDDWQSIYAFQGSRVDLFTDFNKYFQNANDELLLNRTHRYGQELADITSKFVMRNEKLTRKILESHKHLESPVQIVKYALNREDEFSKIFELVEELHLKHPNREILLLARRNKDIKDLLESGYFRKGIDDEVVALDIPDAKIRILTMHSSKGITSDEVIVFRLEERIFPSKGFIEHWIFNYFRIDPLGAASKREEEARLFYVALTRTRNKVYLVVPDNNTVITSFVKELWN